MNNYDDELIFIKNYIKNTFDGFYYRYLYWERLRSLWTAFCIRYNVDTAARDYLVDKFYEDIRYELKRADKRIENTVFPTVEKFKIFMDGLDDNSPLTNENWLHTATKTELKSWIINKVFTDKLFEEIFENARINQITIGTAVENWLNAPHKEEKHG